MIVIYAGTITMDPAPRNLYMALRLEQTRLYRARPRVLGYAITADAVDPLGSQRVRELPERGGPGCLSGHQRTEPRDICAVLRPLPLRFCLAPDRHTGCMRGLQGLGGNFSAASAG